MAVDDDKTLPAVGIPEEWLVRKRIPSRRVVVAIASNGFVEVFAEPGVSVKVVELHGDERDGLDACERLPAKWSDVVWPAALKGTGYPKQGTRRANEASSSILKELMRVVDEYGPQRVETWIRLLEWSLALDRPMPDVIDGLKELERQDAETD